MLQAFGTNRFSFFMVSIVACLAFIFGDVINVGGREDSFLLTDARSQQISIMRVLLDQGVDVKPRDRMRPTVLIWTLTNGSEAEVGVLFRGVLPS